MPPPKLYDVDLEELDFENPLFNSEDIRALNPQRFEMEQLSGIVFIDNERNGAIGFKDVTDSEFWITGHMPGFPLMPGVILCECAAQLAGFFARKFDLIDGDFLGFGGMDDIRFRAPVYPSCRLIIMAQARRIRQRRRAEFEFQAFVDEQMVLSGNLTGVAITRDSSTDIS